MIDSVNYALIGDMTAEMLESLYSELLAERLQIMEMSKPITKRIAQAEEDGTEIDPSDTILSKALHLRAAQNDERRDTVRQAIAVTQESVDTDAW